MNRMTKTFSIIVPLLLLLACTNSGALTSNEVFTVAKRHVQKTETTLIGSDQLPAEVLLQNGKKLLASVIVANAHKLSTLSEDAWNNLQQVERETYIHKAIDELGKGAVESDNAGNKSGGQPALRIVSRAEQFCRCGYVFSKQPKTLFLAQLNKDQVARLKAEKHLIVEGVTV